MTWFGGKSAGCTFQHPTFYQVSFAIGPRGNREYTTKTFSFNDYGSEKDALKAATKWRDGRSLSFGMTKNRIRLVEKDGEEPYLEVQLQDEHIMKCDVEDIELVENSIWTAWKGTGKKVWYVRRRASSKLVQEYAMFHNLVCPNYQEVDHINRDGLDNRRKNLREGTIVNARNKSIQINNTSGIKGVYSSTGSWCAQIGGEKDKRKARFSIKKYGELARELAIAQRKEWEEELGYLD